MVEQTLPFDPIAEARRNWTGHWGEEPALPMAAVTSVMRAQQILLARANEVLDEFGLTFARYEALMLLMFSRDGALPLGKIGERLQVHRTSVTSLIDRLEADGLIRRASHESDRRSTLAELTDAGRGLATHATAAMNSAGFGVDGLEGREQERLIGLLAKLRSAAGDF